MTCTRCGGPLLPDWTCQRCHKDVHAAGPAQRVRRSQFTTMIAAGCAVAVLTALALATSTDLFHQRQTSAAKAIDANPAPQSTRSADAGVVAGPISELAVSGTALTEDAARDVATAWFLKRDPARARNADRTLKSLETADAYRVDQGFTQQILCGCEEPKLRHQLQSVRVLLPTTPVRAFVAQFDTVRIGQPVRVGYTVVFVASSGTWRAALVAANDVDARAFHARTGRPSSFTNSTYARSLLNQLGAYLYTARTTGHVPTSANHHWTGYPPVLAKENASDGQDRADSHGIYWHYNIPVATSAYAFPVAEGELVCGAIADTVAITPPHGHVLNQDPARHNWGLALRPGEYPQLTESFDHEVCMIVRRNGTRDVISYYGTKTGVKAARSPMV
jgi:hypothetical protein